MARWCEAACRCIRFEPDRKAVYEELTAHLRDSAEALEGQGLDPREAALRAVENMGDASEVGQALNRGHNPVLGWLWLISRFTAWFALAALVAVVFLGQAAQRYTLGRGNPMEPVYTAGEGDRPGENYWGVFLPDCEQKAGDYTFSVERAVRHRWDGQDTIYFTLRARTWEFWLSPPEILNRLYAVDSTGAVILNRHNTTTTTEPEVCGNQQGVYLPGSVEYECWATGVSTDAQWVEICFDDMGRSFRLRINMEGAVDDEA